MTNKEIFSFMPINTPFSLFRLELEFINILKLIKTSEAKWFQYQGVEFTEDKKDIVLIFKSSQSSLYIRLKMGLYFYKDQQVKEDTYYHLTANFEQLYDNFRQLKYDNI